MTVRRRLISDLVERLLESHGQISRPIDVERITRELGVKVVRMPDDGVISGMLLRDQKSGQPMIGVNEAHSRSRQRFTIAHELGHFLLHTKGMYVDRTRFRGPASSAGIDSEEVEANEFAAQLLMPADMLAEDLRENPPPSPMHADRWENYIETLAKEYRVSREALGFRVLNLV